MKICRVLIVKYCFFESSGAVLLFTLCQIVLWLCAVGTACSQVSVQRDQQALNILTQTIATGGGSGLIRTIQDVTETGRISYRGTSSNDIQGNVIVKERGLHQLKIEADLSTGKRTTVVNGFGGSLIGEDGRRAAINGQSAVDLGSFTIPYLPLIAAMQNPSISIIYEGIVSHNNVSVYDIRFQRVYTKQQDPQGDQARQETRDVYIDPSTQLIAFVSDHFYLAGPKQHGLEHEDLYSNYQPYNGIMVPLTIMQKVGGHNGFTITFEQVIVNSNLTDAAFTW